MSTTVQTSRASKADLVALAIGLIAVGLLLWVWFPSHPAQRTVAVNAGWLGLAGIAVAVVAILRTGRARLLTGVAALVNAAVLPFAAFVAIPPRIGHFVDPAATEVRAVMAAQASYKQANGSYYDSQLQCLMRPAACIPGYPADRGAFLSQESLSTPRAWYAFDLRSGPRPSPFPGAVSQTSVVSYAYVGAPVDPSSDAKWGICGDSTGVVCWTKGTTPEVSSNGTCVLGRCFRAD